MLFENFMYMYICPLNPVILDTFRKKFKVDNVNSYD